MWASTFEDRLRQWHDLRALRHSDPEHWLLCVNDWWFRVPTVNHYLHWHYKDQWPDPWQLLADDVYCELARALGMLYTIIIDSPSTNDALLATDDNHNLVLVEQGKYILNWCPGDIVNNPSQKLIFQKTLRSQAQGSRSKN